MRLTLSRWTRLLPVLLVLALAGACHMPLRPNNGPWQLVLTMSPPNPSSLDQVKFTLRVVDAKGHPVNDAQASLALTMATMDMGTNLIPLSPAGDGQYTGTGTFSMGGKWNCKITVMSGGHTETQTTSYQIS